MDELAKAYMDERLSNVTDQITLNEHGRLNQSLEDAEYVSAITTKVFNEAKSVMYRRPELAIKLIEAAMSDLYSTGRALEQALDDFKNREV